MVDRELAPHLISGWSRADLHSAGEVEGHESMAADLSVVELLDEASELSEHDELDVPAWMLTAVQAEESKSEDSDDEEKL